METTGNYELGNDNFNIGTNTNEETSTTIGARGVEITVDGNDVTISGETPGPLSLIGSVSTNGEMSMGGKAELQATDDISMGVKGQVIINPAKGAAQATVNAERRLMNYFIR